ncbi:hypothetical protein [Aureimonas populi]|uniref:Glycosyltransferase RgtA/B/C/D-like domain-containing protein n=1 Tax=Aureimonas populi TaxID=1701758 RepID=A0ABW5CKT5_9HYPH|nr:hypothetical protein [Aureimonas populi]
MTRSDAPSERAKAPSGGGGGLAAALPSPLLLLALAVLACAVLAALPLTLPMGPMYWDLVVYIDGAQRVTAGQVPSVDFFAPVGPLGYWLLAGALRLFDEGQPLLLAQWSLLVVTAPAMALVLRDVDRRSRPLALALLGPFLFFQLLPINIEQYSVYPGVDGYGIYNRQVCHLLYVLTAALVFVEGRRTLLAVVAWCCLSLFLLKITGFLAAGLLCAYALAAGRVSWRIALGCAAIFLAALGALELSLRLPSAYLADIAALVKLNEGSIARRFVQAASIHFGIVGPGAILLAWLLLSGRRTHEGDLRAWAGRSTMARLAAALDRPALWLGIALFAALFAETQNTGGHGFIFLWPILLLVLAQARPGAAGRPALTALLVAAVALPPAVNVFHRSMRAIVGQTQYEVIEGSRLKTLGAATQRAEVLERARILHDIYATYPQPYQAMADAKVLPTYGLYSDLDFQVGWFEAADEAVGAILAYEAAQGVRFETIMSLNFANPFPWLLDRQGPHHIAIGADPTRAVPPPDAQTLEAVAQTDLVLEPLCPITSANDALRRLYEPGLAEHRIVPISRCWRGYVRF